MEAVIYNPEGKKSGEIKLSADVFGLPWNADLVYQVVHGQEENARRTTSHVKDRSEVKGGGRKPWRQKGTGRARHGSIRSPIWTGGGVTHGPNKNEKYGQKINQKMKTKALFTVLSRKWRDQEVLFVNDLALTVPKTKTAAATLKNMAETIKLPSLAYKRGRRVLLLTPEATPAIRKSFSNLGGTLVMPVSQLNPLSALSYKHIIVLEPEKSVKLIAARQAVRSAKK